MSAYSDRVIADGATNYWRLNETSGTTAADSVGTLTGTISGGVTLGTAGRQAGDLAIQYTSALTGQVNVVPGPVLASGASTLEIWVYPTGPVLNDAIIVQPGTFQWYWSGGTTVRFVPLGGPLDWPMVLPLNVWAQLVIVLSAGQALCYVNGAQGGPSASPHLRGLRVGAQHRVRLATAKAGWAKLQDCAVYARALSAAEVLAHYTLGSTEPSGAKVVQFVGVAAVDGPNTATLVFPAPTKSGNAIVVMTRANPGTGVTGVTGYPFTALDQISQRDPSISSWLAQNIVGANTPIVVQFGNIVGTVCCAWAWEVTGVAIPDALSAHGLAQGSPGSDCLSIPVTTPRSAMLLLGASVANFATYTPGPGYTLDDGKVAPIGAVGLAGAEHRLATGPLTAEVQHILSGATEPFTTALVALLEPAIPDAGNLQRLFVLLGEAMPVFNKHVPVVPAADNLTDFTFKKGQTSGPYPCDALYVGGAGDVAAVDLDNVAVVFTGVPAGSYLPGHFRRVNAAGTTATNLLAAYIN